jgi:hypothetical protein
MATHSISPRARKRLRGLLAEKSPEYPDSPNREEARAADRALVQSGALSESQLIALYASAYGAEPVEEEEFKVPNRFRMRRMISSTPTVVFPPNGTPTRSPSLWSIPTISNS